MPEQETIAYEEKIRRLLAAIRSGDRDAFDTLINAVSHELQKLSAFRLRQQPHAYTLQTTALVNEVVLRLIGMLNNTGAKFPDTKEGLMALTSHLMRCTLADYARKRKLSTVSLDDGDIPLSGWAREDLDTLIALDQALTEIAHSSATSGERRSKAVELFLFGGMNYREIADELNITDDMARRDCHIGVARLRQIFAGKAD